MHLYVWKPVRRAPLFSMRIILRPQFCIFANSYSWFFIVFGVEVSSSSPCSLFGSWGSCYVHYWRGAASNPKELLHSQGCHSIYQADISLFKISTDISVAKVHATLHLRGCHTRPRGLKQGSFRPRNKGVVKNGLIINMARVLRYHPGDGCGCGCGWVGGWINTAH